MNSNGNRPSFDIAIIGAGIIGAHVAIGLLNRNIPVTIYEQSNQVKEIGAGIGIPSVVVDCMTALHPGITQCLEQVAGKFESANYINGCSDEELKLRPADRLYDMEFKSFEYRTSHRAQLLDKLLQLIPKDGMKLGKHLESIVERGDGEKLLLQFGDGTTAEADAGITIAQYK